MRRTNHWLLLKASTTALALAGGAGFTSAAWADATPECNIGSSVDPVSGLVIFETTSLECGELSNADGAGSSAIGAGSVAADIKATAVGALSKALAVDSLALGASAQATVEAIGGVAIGANSIVSERNVVSFGDASTNLRRRLVNISRGIDANDAVTVGQLDEVEEQIKFFKYFPGGALGPLVVGQNALGIGADAVSNGEGSIAIGFRAQANRLDPGLSPATALGADAKATASGALSLGAAAEANSTSSIAIGDGAKITGEEGGKPTSTSSIAIGSGAEVNNAEQSIALGKDASARAGNAVGIGLSVKANGLDSVALGSSAQTSGSASVAIGVGAEVAALADNSMAFGTGAIVGSDPTFAAINAIAIGSAAKSDAESAIALGNGAFVEGIATSAIAIGKNAKVENTINVVGNDPLDAIAIGRDSLGGGIEALAMGRGARAEREQGIAIGSQAVTSGTGAIGIGLRTESRGLKSVVIGGDARTTIGSGGSIAIGDSSFASGRESIAIGIGVQAGKPKDPATGELLLDPVTGLPVPDDGNGFGATGDLSIAMGLGAAASDVSSVAIGTQSLASGQSAWALGSNAKATGDSALAFGNLSEAKGLSAVAIGFSATVDASAADSLAFGKDAKVSARSTGPLPTDITTFLPTNALAIGTSARAEETSAIAVGLNAKADRVDTIALGRGALATANSSVAIGADSVADRVIPTGLGKPIGTVAFGSTNKERQLIHVAAGTADTDAVNVAQLNAALDGVTANPFFVSESEQDLVSPNLPIARGTDAIALGALATADSDNSVALGAGSVASRDLAGLPTTTVGVVSIGDVDKERQLINVANGTQGTDAVNKRQLDGVETALDNRLDTAELDIDSLQEESRFLTVNSNALAGAAVASGADGVALGSGANVNANATNGVALGKDATINAGITNSVALGAGSVASDSNTVSVGKAGSERKITNLAKGTAATDAVNVTQLDDKTKYLSVNSTLGVASATGTNAIALGPVSTAVGTDTVAIGNGSNVIANGAVALGSNTSIDGTATGAIALGQGATIAARVIGPLPTDITTRKPTDAIAIGRDSLVEEQDAIAIGREATASRNDTIALGRQASATGPAAIAMGERTESTGLASLAFGIGARSLGQRSLSIGADSFADGVNSIAIGIGLGARKIPRTDPVTGLPLPDDGNGLGAHGDGSVSIGNASRSLGLSSVALGDVSSADVDFATAIGTATFATGIGSTALGAFANANGNDSVAVGAALADGRSSVAMGLGAIAQEADGVALGSGSVANRGNAVSFGNDVADIDGDGDPLTNPIFQRQLINVADGTQDTDAVNLRQLNIVDDRVGALELAQQYLSVNSTDDPASATGEDAIALGEETSASALNSIAIGKTSKVGAGSNGSIALGADSQVTDGTVNAVALGANSIANEKDTVSIGTTLGGGQRRLVNLADGTAPTDAVNKRQLDLVDAKTKYIFIDSDGAAPLVDGVDAIGIGEGATSSSDKTIALGTNSDASALFAVSLGGDSSATGLGAVAVGHSAKARTEGSVALGDLAEVAFDTGSSVAIGAGSLADRDLGTFATDVVGTVSFGKAGELRQLVNIADGTEDTDAANVRQLNALRDDLTNPFLAINSIVALAGDEAIAGGVNSIALGTRANASGNNSVALGAGSIASAANVVSVGFDGNDGDGDPLTNPAFQRKIVNVAAGNLVDGSTDAVNADQLVDEIRTVNTTIIDKTKYLSVRSTGADASATGTESIAIGGDSSAVGNDSLALGTNARSVNDRSVAIGNNSFALANDSIAIGIGNAAAGLEGGVDSNGNGVLDPGEPRFGARGEAAIAIGRAALADTKDSTAIGASASASGEESTALGSKASASGDNAAAFGSESLASGAFSTAFGTSANASGQHSVAIGSAARSTGQSALALGAGAVAQSQDGVALGSGSFANRGNAISFGNDQDDGDGNPATNPVFQRQLINVADGTQDTDAVNLRQLNDAVAEANPFFVSQSTDLAKKPTATGAASLALGELADATGNHSVALGDGSVAGVDNVVSVGSSTLQRKIINVAAGSLVDGGTDAVNADQLVDQIAGVNLNITNLGNSIDARINNITADTKFLAVGSNAAAAAALAAGTDSIALGAGANASGNRSVALGDGSIAGVDNVVSVGSSTLQRKIINVAAGNLVDGSTDAVNADQLVDEIADVRADIAGDITNITNTTNDTINAKTKYVAVNSTAADASAAGTGAIAVGGGSSVAATVTGGIALGENAKVNTGALNSVAIGAGSIADRVPVAGTAGTVSFGTAGAERQLVHVADATQATDAVNKRQLDLVEQNLTTLINTVDGGASPFFASETVDVAKAAKATGTDAVAMGANADAKSANSVALGAGSVADRALTGLPATTVGVVSVGDVGKERQIINLADGTQATDAVNKRQLDVVDAKTKYLSIKSTAAVASAFGVDSVAIGGGAATGLLARDGIAIGSGAQVNIDNAIAMGKLATVDATAKGAIAIGAGAKVFARDTDSAQPGVQETVDLPVGAIAFGNTAQATEKEAISIGSGIANRKEAISIGQQNIVNGANSIAIGKFAQTAFDDSIAMGRNANTLFAGGVAIGRDAQALTPDSVALGSDSNTGSRSDVVSIGSDGTIIGSIVKTRQLTNLKAGTQATDAVNKGQMDSELDKIREDLGGDITNISTDVTTATSTIINEKTKYLAVNSAGTDAAATATESIALGGGSSVAAGVNGGIALGSNAKVNAGALNSVAIGAGSIADRVPVAGTAGTVSFGTTATGGQRQLVNIAAGTQATDAVNKGQMDAAIQQLDLAIKDIDVRNPFLAIDSTVAIAENDEAFASGGDAMALGKSARAEAQQGLALGFAANVVGQRGIALGSNASASGTDSVALGANSIANRGNAVSVGSDSLQRQIINVAAGTAATDAVNKAQLDDVERKIVTFDGKIGDQITNINTTVQAAAKAAPWTSIKSVEGEDGVAVATGEDAIALGKESQARGNDTVAIGNGAIAEGDASVSIGKGNRATGKGAVAIGDPNVASGTGAFAGGDENRAIGDGALALGNLNKAFGKSAIALGDNATAGAVQIDPATGLAIIDPVTGDPIPVNSGNIAIGDAASATNADNIAIGSGAKVNVANAMALGKGATVGAAGANSIALGNGSIANEANVLSVGAVGAERRIVNVAQGVGANDAVNVSQLTQAVQNIVAGVNPFFITSSTSGKATANGADSIALGKDATTNGDNSVALGTGSIANENGVVSVGAVGAERKITNVKAGLISETSTDAVNGAQLLAEVNRAITQSVNPFVTVNSTGGRSTATGSDAVAIGKDSFATGEKAVALGQGASVDATAQNSVALGAGSVVAAEVDNVVSIGSSTLQRKIVNVADGLVALGSKEAVNGGQLAAVKTVADNALTVANQALTTIKQVNGDVTKVTDTANTALARTQYLEVNSTGAKPKATGEDAIALGENAIANSKDSLAVGTNANATGVAALAIGSGAKSNGAGAIALGNGASSDGSLSVAIGNGAIAGKSGSVAIGQGVTTTRDNQIAVGNSTTTVTMAGLGSTASAAAQTGTTKFVTGDSLGNLAYSTFSTADIVNLQKSVADLTGQFSTISTQIEGLGRRAREADGGIAAAMALGGTMLLPDTSVSVSFNLATYRGEQGFSGAVVAKVRENVWVSGGIGGSTVKRSTGGRVGISFGW